MRSQIMVPILALLLLAIPLQFSGEGDPEPHTEPVEPDFIEIEQGGVLVVEAIHGGSSYSVILMEVALDPPAEGEPSLPFISHPLRTRGRVEDIRAVRSSPRVIKLNAAVIGGFGMFRASDRPELGSLIPRSYPADRTYPVNHLNYRYMGSSWDDMTQYHHTSVSVCPFDYDPSSNTLIHYERVALMVVEGPQDLSSPPSRQVSAPPSFKEGTRLLIVANPSLMDELEPYRQWNMRKGVMTTLLPFSTVDSTYSSLDAPSSLWQYVHDSYFGSDTGLEYVLLVGEVNTVPTRTVKDLNPYIGEPATLPADTYFSCLGGPSSGPDIWNANGNSDWGEVQDIQDFISEVYVSRIALSTRSATTQWVQKVINYESNPPQDLWGGRAGLFGADTHNYYDGADQCDYLWSKHMSKVYSDKSPYYSNGYYGSTPLTYSNIKSGFNNGFSVVVYMGHGLSTIWSEGFQDEARWLFDANEAHALSQGSRLPYITAMSCETNWFDGSHESISEAFTENGKGGAISYVGASRTTYGGIGYNTYYPGAPGIQEDVLRMISQTTDRKYRSAEIFAEAKNYYADAWGSYFSSSQPELAYNAWMEHNLLGPAQTPVWTAKPLSLTVSYTYNEDYYTNFTVLVKDQSSAPVKNAAVTIYSPVKDRMSTLLTDAQGRAVVPFVIDEIQAAKLTVTALGFRPYLKDLVLMDDTIPTTTAVLDLQVPDGSSGWYVSDPGLSLTCSEPGNTYYRWNEGNRLSYKGGITVLIGDNLLKYWSEDLSGNVEQIRTLRIKFDPSAPVMEYAIDPIDPDGLNGFYNTLPVIRTSLDPSSGSPQWVEYWWDKGAKEISDGSITAIEGEHTLYLVPVDEAGNRGEQVSIELKVDTVVPTTSFFTGGVDPNDAGWYTSPFSITLKCDDRFAETRYRWDDGEWTKYKDPLDPLEGEHSFSYYSFDPNGNIEEENVLSIAYDVTPPSTAFTISPSDPDGDNGHYRTKPTVSISADEPGSTIMYSLDGTAFMGYQASLRLDDGKHFIEAYSIDPAGNIGTKTSMTFLVDTSYDRIDVDVRTLPAQTGWYLEPPHITLRSGEGTSIFYSWEGETLFQRYTGSILPPIDEGVASLIYYSVDLAGNKGPELRMEFSVDSLPPSASLEAPQSARPGEVVVIDLSGSTDGIDVKGYWIDPGDGTDPEWSTDPIYRHVYGRPGTYRVKAMVRDSAGHESDEVVMAITVEEDTSVLLILAAVIGALIVLSALAMLVVALVHHNRSHRAHAPPPLHPNHMRPHPSHVGGSGTVPVVNRPPPVEPVRNPPAAPISIPPPPRPPQAPKSPSVK
ncbi:MAG: C25 family cysteine peptidase [Candidatus Thermoplasmatota archaeon]|nr:C25 family cysteine peptidase [Candidatus Thermoplasmatota archaeon]